MTERTALREAFLTGAGWGSAHANHLAGDASVRSYLRLTQKGKTAILMDADPAVAGTSEPFAEIAAWLRNNGFSAPRIYNADLNKGFMLLEDFGDALFAKSPASEQTLYTLATDVLVELQTRPTMAGLPLCNPSHLGMLARSAWDWYAGHDPSLCDEIETDISELAQTFTPDCSVVILRDYHAENLIYLPDRQGVKQAGLLDFQDAMIGHPAYDLVSLLQDARRDISPDLETVMIGHFLSRTGHDPRRFDTAYHLLGAIRHLRILGVFARLNRVAGKPGYLKLMPRVWSYLLRDLKHPALAKLQARVLADLPEPTPARIQEMANT